MTIPTYQIECKKDGMRQNQDGLMKLTLALHPNDIPSALYTDPMGQRYMMVLAPIADDDQPRQAAPSASGDASPPERAGKDKRAWAELSPVEQAGILSTSAEFAAFAHQESNMPPVEYLRRECGVASRSELKFNTAAQKKLKELSARFYDWKNYGAVA